MVLISWLSTSNFYFLIGLVPLFPTFTIVGQFTTWSTGGVEALRNMTLFGIVALIPYILYLASVYFLANKLNIVTTLSIALTVWSVSALALVEFWKSSKGS